MDPWGPSCFGALGKCFVCLLLKLALSGILSKCGILPTGFGKSLDKVLSMFRLSLA